MALLDDLAKGSPVGLVVGVGAGLLAPALAPAITGVLRPAAKAVMRTGIMLYRGAMEPLGAAVGELVAEAQVELAAASAGSAAATAPEPPDHPQKPRHHKRQGGTHHA